MLRTATIYYVIHQDNNGMEQTYSSWDCADETIQTKPITVEVPVGIYADKRETGNVVFINDFTNTAYALSTDDQGRPALRDDTGSISLNKISDYQVIKLDYSYTIGRQIEGEQQFIENDGICQYYTWNSYEDAKKAADLINAYDGEHWLGDHRSGKDVFQLAKASIDMDYSMLDASTMRLYAAFDAVDFSVMYAVQSESEHSGWLEGWYNSLDEAESEAITQWYQKITPSERNKRQTYVIEIKPEKETFYEAINRLTDEQIQQTMNYGDYASFGVEYDYEVGFDSQNEIEQIHNSSEWEIYALDNKYYLAVHDMTDPDLTIHLFQWQGNEEPDPLNTVDQIGDQWIKLDRVVYMMDYYIGAFDDDKTDGENYDETGIVKDIEKAVRMSSLDKIYYGRGR